MTHKNVPQYARMANERFALQEHEGLSARIVFSVRPDLSSDQYMPSSH